MKRVVRSKITRAKDSSYTHWVVVVMVLIIGLAVSVFFWNNSRSRVSSDVNSKVQHQASLMEALLSLRLQQVSNTLNGGSGLLTINPAVTQADWAAFYQAYNLKQNYPGIDAVSFSKYVTAANLANYLGSVTATKPNFVITPIGNRADYAPVTFVAAISPVSLQSIGYDPLADTVRGAAMRTARDTGTTVMTGKITLVAAHKGQPAFVVYKPLYNQVASTVASRRAAIYGYVFAAVNVANMLNNISGEIQSSSYAFQIADGSGQLPASLMYQTANFNSLKKRPIKTNNFSLAFASHSWKVKLVAAGSIIPTSERQLPLEEFLRGLAATAVLGGMFWYITTKRERKLARERQLEVQSAKDDLLSLASHQLRTPATIVKQHIGLLLQNYGGKITKHQREILDTAYTGNQRQLEIINQFLEVARLDSGRIKLRKKRVNVNKLLDDLIKLQQKLVAKRGQKILVKLPKKAPIVMADPQYLPMALENLLSNASKYTPSRGRITLQVRKSSNELLIAISDNGIGIPADELDSIFDKFTRLDNDFTADGDGSGIGLYLTKQIIELHGGNIDVESTPGNGSKFTVHLPIDRGK